MYVRILYRSDFNQPYSLQQTGVGMLTLCANIRISVTERAMELEQKLECSS